MVELAEGVFWLPDCLARDECRNLIARSEAMRFAPAAIGSPADGPIIKQFRNNDRVVFEDEQLAAWLWTRVGPALPREFDGHEVVGLNECLRFYRYRPGQRFRWHLDGSYRRPGGQRSRLTLLVYLNDRFWGGATRFRQLTVRPVRGAALAFRHELPHEGQAVRWGTKYVLRSDVMCGP